MLRKDRKKVAGKPSTTGPFPKGRLLTAATTSCFEISKHKNLILSLSLWKAMEGAHLKPVTKSPSVLNVGKELLSILIRVLNFHSRIIHDTFNGIATVMNSSRLMKESHVSAPPLSHYTVDLCLHKIS